MVASDEGSWNEANSWNSGQNNGVNQNVEVNLHIVSATSYYCVNVSKFLSLLSACLTS